MEKWKGKGVVAKLLFFISVYEFPYCNTIYLIIIIINIITSTWLKRARVIWGAITRTEIPDVSLQQSHISIQLLLDPKQQISQKLNTNRPPQLCKHGQSLPIGFSYICQHFTKRILSPVLWLLTSTIKRPWKSY